MDAKDAVSMIEYGASDKAMKPEEVMPYIERLLQHIQNAVDKSHWRKAVLYENALYRDVVGFMAIATSLEQAQMWSEKALASFKVHHPGRILLL